MNYETQPQYRMGERLRIMVDGKPQLTGTVLDRLTSRVKGCGDHLYHFYAMGIPSTCLPGQVNLMWVPEYSVGTPEEMDSPLSTPAPRAASVPRGQPSRGPRHITHAEPELPY